MLNKVRLILIGFSLWFLHLVKLNKHEFWRSRMKICKSCPIYENGVCSNKFYVTKAVGNSWYIASSKDYDERDYLPYPNMKRGCGCVCIFKTQIKDEQCPANFW